jgi:hypothetical protein
MIDNAGLPIEYESVLLTVHFPHQIISSLLKLEHSEERMTKEIPCREFSFGKVFVRSRNGWGAVKLHNIYRI